MYKLSEFCVGNPATVVVTEVEFDEVTVEVEGDLLVKGRVLDNVHKLICNSTQNRVTVHTTTIDNVHKLICNSTQNRVTVHTTTIRRGCELSPYTHYPIR